MEGIKKNVDQADSLYVFNGKSFLEYIDFIKIKNAVLSLGIPIEDTVKLSEIYTYVVKNCPAQKKNLDKIFFENIMYSHLKNIYINTFDENIDVNTFKSRMKKILNKTKGNSDIPYPYSQLATEHGFYLMDLIHVTATGAKFISGFNIDEKDGQLKSAKILFVEAVNDKMNLSRYFVAGIDINFEEKSILTMIRNIGDIKEKEKDLGDEEDYDYHLARTIPGLYRYVKEEIIEVLIKKTEEIDKEKDRKALYNLCKNLDNELLDDIRKTVQEKASDTIERSVSDIITDLYHDLEDRPKKSDRDEIIANIESLMIANYIKTKHGSNNRALSKEAKKKKLPGYTTKIKFRGNRSNRGATQSAGSKQPVSATDMFHSLYISFKQALGLEVWGMSWFEDYNYTNSNNTKVLQTSIYSQTTQFKIVFLPKRSLDKEIIYHVVRYINKQRQQEVDND